MIAEVLERIVQGPEESQRFERTLRVDPCAESTRPGSLATQAVIVTTAARRLIELAKAGEKLRTVLVAGERDPMRHPDFREVSENLRELVNKHYAKAQLTLVADAIRLGDADRRIALGAYHKPILRFEYGTQKSFAALTGENPKLHKDVVEHLQRLELERWVLEVCFVKGAADNSTESELRNWLVHVGRMKPAAIHVRTLAKPDADKKLKPLAKPALDKLVQKIAEKTGVEVQLVEPK